MMGHLELPVRSRPRASPAVWAWALYLGCFLLHPWAGAEETDDGRFTWIAASDHFDEPAKGLVDRILKARPAFVVGIGDIVFQSRPRDHRALKRLLIDPLVGIGAKFYPAVGNHDFPVEPNWFKFWAPPANQLYYSFDHGNSHFVVLDTNRAEAPDDRQFEKGTERYHIQKQGADFRPGSKQYAWLVKDLKQTNKTHVFVFFHVPAFSFGGHWGKPSIQQALCPIFERHKVTAVLQSHSHAYERFVPLRFDAPSGKPVPDARKGITYVVTGGGGMKLADIKRHSTHAAIAKDFHFTKIEVDGQIVRCSAVRASDGKVLDSFRLKSRRTGSTPATSSSPPSQKRDGSFDLARHWDLSSAEQYRTKTRSKICLNGFWQFSPVQKATFDPTGEWRFLKVPGGFHRNFHILDSNLKALRSSEIERIQEETELALYRRTFALDETFRDMRVSLEFEFILDRGTVWINDQRLKTITPSESISDRTIDISEYAKIPGENEVRVLVQCRKGQAWRKQAGINGNVWLLAEPGRPRIDDQFISTSVRTKELRVELDLIGTEQPGLSIDGEVRERPSAEAKVGKTVFAIRGRPTGQGQSRIAVNLQPHWDNIQLWNFENPRLYDLVLNLRRGDEIIDQTVTRFGFCETWVKGPDFYWNGKVLHRRRTYRVIEQWAHRYDQRADPRYFREFIRQYKRAGFNDFSTTGSGTYVAQMEDFLRVCDEEGVLVWAPIILDHGPALKDKDGARAKAFGKIRAAIRHYRNHPCIAAWGAWGPIGFTPDENTRNPHNWGPGLEPIMNGATRIREFYQQSYEAMKNADRTRPVVFQSLLSYGDAVAGFLYPCFGTPVQEIESWPSQWRAAPSRKPFWVLESDFIYSEAWYRMRQSPRENLVYQQAVRTQGPKGYFMGPADDPEPGVIEGSRSVCKADTRVGGLIVHDHVPPIYLQTRGEATVRAVRAWRAFGFATFGLGDDFHNMYDVLKVTAEIPVHRKFHVPHEQLKTRGPYVDYQMYAEEFVNLLKPELPRLASPSPVFDALRDQALAPFIAFIAHQGKDIAHFTHKDHAYWTGETIPKQVVLINDHADQREVSVTVVFGEAGGRSLPVLTKSFELNSGEIRFLPFSVRAPRLEGPAVRKDYEFRLSATIADGEIARLKDNPCSDINASWPKTRRDTFAVQVFSVTAEKVAAPHLKIGLYDEVGRTRDLLSITGLPFTDLGGSTALDGVNLVVVGRESMTSAFQKLARGLGLTVGIEAGDTDLLVFEQTRESAPPLSADLDDLSIRSCFTVDGSHPVLDGLRERDFRDWRGESDLLPSAPLYRFYWMPGTKRFQKWTNEGIVTSTILRKPHFGNFRPLLDGDFDLRGTPLLEWLHGNGRILFCQLDVTTGRYGKDPVVTQLVGNLFRYFESRAAAPKKNPFKPVYLFGQNPRVLDDRRVKYEPFGVESARGTLVISGAPKAAVLSKAREIRSFAGRGGSVFYLVDSPDAFAADLLPVAVDVSPRKASRYKLFAGRSITRGLGQGDLFFKTMPEFLNFSGECEPLTGPGLIAQIRHGDGRFVLVPQIDPAQFARTWTAPKVARLYSILLTNLGVRQTGLDLGRAGAPETEKAVSWGFENRLAGWSGGTLSRERVRSGKSSIKITPNNRNVWNRGAIELHDKAGICTLADRTFFKLAGFAEEAVFIIVTLTGDGFSREYEYRCGAGEWCTVAMPISEFPSAKGNFAGRKLTEIRIRWGGPEDTSKHYDVYFDDIYLGPAPVSIFSRCPDVPTYDPSYFTTW
ncbi:MAG: metallophosphoesterase [Planctomycetota bacterium]|nr:metallophosphoesterase [Planctomycetota bacterium]